MTRRIRMSYTLAQACAADAGNRSMRAAGRTRWSMADWNASVEEFNRVWPLCPCHRCDPEECPEGWTP